MFQIVATLLASIRLALVSPVLVVISALIIHRDDLLTLLKVPSFILVIADIIYIGWFGAVFYFLTKLLNKKPFTWWEILPRIVQSFRLLIPLFLIILVTLLLPLLAWSGWYVYWLIHEEYLSSLLEQQTLSLGQLILMGFSEPSIMQVFINQSKWTQISFEFSKFLVVLSVFVVKMVMVAHFADRVGLIKAITRVLRMLIVKWWVFLLFVGLQLVGNQILIELNGWFDSSLLPLLPGLLTWLPLGLFIILVTLLSLVLDALLVVSYSRYSPIQTKLRQMHAKRSRILAKKPGSRLASVTTRLKK